MKTKATKSVRNKISIQKCTCLREYCDFFIPGEGEWGTSYSRSELEQEIKEKEAWVKSAKQLLFPKRK